MIKNKKYLKFLLGFSVFLFSFLEGSDFFERKFGISIDGNLLLLILGVLFIIGLLYTYFEDKLENKENKEIKKTNNYSLHLNIGLSIVTIILFYFYYNKGKDNENILEEVLPSIHEAYEKGDINSVYNKTKGILEKYPENSVVQSYFDKVTTSVNAVTLDTIVWDESKGLYEELIFKSKGFHQTSTHKFTKEELIWYVNYFNFEYKIIRNEIFARHGYIFILGGEMDKYFRSKEWYIPKFNNVNHFLSDIEKHNIQLIKQLEK